MEPSIKNTHSELKLSYQKNTSEKIIKQGFQECLYINILKITYLDSKTPKAEKTLQ